MYISMYFFRSVQRSNACTVTCVAFTVCAIGLILLKSHVRQITMETFVCSRSIVLDDNHKNSEIVAIF